MRDTREGNIMQRLIDEPIDVPVAICHMVFVLATISMALVAWVGIATYDAAAWDAAASCAGVALISYAVRDGIAEGHRIIDARRGITS